MEPGVLPAFFSHVAFNEWRCTMRGALLWLIGIPLPIVILLYVFGYL